MRRRALATLALVGACGAMGGTPAEAGDRLTALAPIVGSCWEGRFEGSELVDLRCIEPMLDGVHVRDVHEVVGTGYRGETVYTWDAQAGRITYAYYNTLGGVARGWIVPEDGELRSEGLYRGPDGTEREVGMVLTIEGDRMVQTSLEGGRETARIVFERRASGAFGRLTER